MNEVSEIFLWNMHPNWQIFTVSALIIFYTEPMLKPLIRNLSPLHNYQAE